LKTRIIPNELVLATIAVGVCFQITYYGAISMITALFTMAGMMILFSVAAGMVGFGKVGAGDMKLAGAMGLALGYPGILTALAAMSAGLLIYSLTGLFLRKLTMKSAFPFAPFMMLGLAVSLLKLIYIG